MPPLLRFLFSLVLIIVDKSLQQQNRDSCRVPLQRIINAERLVIYTSDNQQQVVGVEGAATTFAPENTVITVTCNSEDDGDQQQVFNSTCQKNGSWSPRLLTLCQKSPVDSPATTVTTTRQIDSSCQVPPVANGQLSLIIDDDDEQQQQLEAGEQIQVGAKVKLSCNNNASPVDREQITSFCSFGGFFTPPIGRCQQSRQSCSARNRPSSVQNGKIVVFDGNNQAGGGARRQVKCDEGYQLQPGSNEFVICQANGTWSQPGSCIQIEESTDGFDDGDVTTTTTRTSTRRVGSSTSTVAGTTTRAGRNTSRQQSTLTTSRTISPATITSSEKNGQLTTASGNINNFPTSPQPAVFVGSGNQPPAQQPPPQQSATTAASDDVTKQAWFLPVIVVVVVIFLILIIVLSAVFCRC